MNDMGKRYYFKIGDNNIKWPHKYLTVYMSDYDKALPLKYYRLLIDSEYAILTTEYKAIYIKNRNNLNRKVDPNDLILIKLSSIDLEDFDI